MFKKETMLALRQARKDLLEYVQAITPINDCGHIKSRIKAYPSIIEKMTKKGFSQHEINDASVMTALSDIIGIRIVVQHIDDVYRVANILQSRLPVKEIQDYIKHPKPSGYRSYHIITTVKLSTGNNVDAEIQIRTLGMDFWANLEHSLIYSPVKNGLLNKNDIAFIQEELKHYASDINSIDTRIQALHSKMQQ